MIRPPPRPPLFPYPPPFRPRLAEPHGETFRYRSPNSDLLGILLERASGLRFTDLLRDKLWRPLGAASDASVAVDMEGTARTAGDRKSTRLNSSHGYISYAVF